MTEDCYKTCDRADDADQGGEEGEPKLGNPKGLNFEPPRFLRVNQFSEFGSGQRRKEHLRAAIIVHPFGFVV
jgi:hypothetical protein